MHVLLPQISTPLAAILALTELVETSAGEFTSCAAPRLSIDVITAGTMFELVQALNDGAASASLLNESENHAKAL